MSGAEVDVDGGLLRDLIDAGAAQIGLEAVTRPLLKALGDATGLESTYLTRIDLAADVQTILYARNVGDMRIDEGLEVPWADTLCKRALESGQVCTADVPAVWGDSDAAAALGIQSYVSAPISLPDGRIIGTLCGASATQVEVDERTAALLRLFSHVIADQLLREQVAQEAQDRALTAEQDLRDRVEFVAESTHALKGPLAVVHGWLQLFELREQSPESLGEGLTAMRRAVDMLHGRIDRILQESQAFDVARRLVVEPVDLGDLVDRLAKDLRSPGHTFQVEIEAARANADPHAVTIVVEHLVENAIKYSPANSTITLRCAPAYDQKVALEVCDEGVGIPTDLDVFEPFAQADRNGLGVGLGLHIVRTLTTAMHGTVTARRNPQIGSTFRVELPAAR